MPAWNLYITPVVGFIPFRLTLSMLVSSLFFQAVLYSLVSLAVKDMKKMYTKQFSFALRGMRIVIF